jgi:aminoglycoside 3-N-acetyltransferase
VSSSLASATSVTRRSTSRSTAHGPIRRDGERVWAEFDDIEISDEDFDEIGADFETDRPDAVRRGHVGVGEATLVEQVALVDYAVGWFERNRG